MNDSVFINNCGTPINGESNNDDARRKPYPKFGSRGRGFKMNAGTGVFNVKGHHADWICFSYPEKLLTTAKDLIEKGEFSVAVVVAHMACEISVERAIYKAFKAKGVDYLQRPVKDLLSSYNLANDIVQNLYNAVTDSEIQNEAFWQQFKESATTRNKAVHEGRIATKAEAEASFNAASSLVKHLK
jgi:hypothetical protein